MSKSGPIVIIEDDEDDKEIFESIVRELGIQNEIKWFVETESAFDFLKTTDEKVFLIFSDINLPGKNGIQFKYDIDADPELRKKSIPFVFLSTYASQKDVEEAYIKVTVQGFFIKGTDYGEIKKMLQHIFEYWKNSKHPNSF
ncbi:response regulator [Marivirga sp. S37H4]|uniref:Response regulator n=1 Tax=Marivirga aurantiaca TaxID=2802615 RepID=A0A934X0H2_9BACT|nr:response regulator [Marivirga aurantiaca]MBK6266175.1 response regulator [Marivirga aurantiaca]